jgi:ATP-dependent RNA helicase DOB1
LAKYNNVPPELDPINDLGVKDQSFKNDIEHLKKLEEQISIHPIRQRPDFDTIYAGFERKLQLHEEMKVAREELKTIKSGQFSEELTHRQKVLRRMGYIDIYGTITQKGLLFL